MTELSSKRPSSGLLNSERAAAYLGISVNTLNCWRSQRTHDIPYVKVGRRVYYRHEALDKFLRDQTVDFSATG